MSETINKFIKEVRNSTFFKNIFTLVSGTAIAQLIPIFLQPVLRRLYSPEEFGAFAIYLTAVGVLGVLCSLRYEQAIVIPESETVASNIFVLSIFIGTISSLLIFILIFFFRTQLGSFIKFPVNYNIWLLFIPVSVFLITIYEAVNNWLIRHKSFRASAINKVSRRTFEGAVQVTFGFNKSAVGLFLGDVIGNLANVISGIFQTLKTGFSIDRISRVRINYALFKYVEFPKYNLFPNLLNTVSNALPIFLINDLYTKATVGHFDLSRQVLSIPAALITVSIYQVLYQKVSEIKNKGLSIKNEVRRLLIILSALGLLEILAIFFFGVPLFRFFFGEQWLLAGEYSKILVFSYTIKIIVSPLSAVFIPLGRIKLGALWQISYFFIMFSFFFIKKLPFEVFVKYYVAADIFSYMIFLFLILFVVRDYEKKIHINSSQN